MNRNKLMGTDHQTVVTRGEGERGEGRMGKGVRWVAMDGN